MVLRVTSQDIGKVSFSNAIPKCPFDDFLYPQCLLLFPAKTPEVSLLLRLSPVAACSLQSSLVSYAHGWHFVLHAAASHKEAYTVHGSNMLTLLMHLVRASSDWMHS